MNETSDWAARTIDIKGAMMAPRNGARLAVVHGNGQTPLAKSLDLCL